jgi:hypothetical protein
MSAAIKTMVSWPRCAAIEQWIQTMARKSNQKPTSEVKENVMKNGNEAMKNGFETVTKTFEKFSGFGKGNVEAYMQATTAFAKVFERINSEVINFSKQQVEDGVAAFKAVSSAKSFHEAWEVQTDAYVAQATKMNDLWMDAAKQAAEPFSSQITEFTEKMQEFRTPFARAAE